MRIAILFLFLIGIVLVSGCTDTNDVDIGSDSANFSTANNSSELNLTDVDIIENEGIQMVENGDFVKVDYIGELEDGTVFDTSIEEVAKEAGMFNPGRQYEPLGFTVGAGQMIAGFDKGVVGMEVGEEKTITIPPEEAYGVYREDLVQAIPLEEFKQNVGMEPVVGQTLYTGAGQPVTIKDVNETAVFVDFNHNLAGKTLIFKVTLVSIGEE